MEVQAIAIQMAEAENERDGTNRWLAPALREQRTRARYAHWVILLRFLQEQGYTVEATGPDWPHRGNT